MKSFKNMSWKNRNQGDRKRRLLCEGKKEPKTNNLQWCFLEITLEMRVGHNLLNLITRSFDLVNDDISPIHQGNLNKPG